MLRPVSLLPALAAVVSLAAPLAAPAAAGPGPAAAERVSTAGRLLDTAPAALPARTATAAEATTPLTVTIDALTPSYLPEKGPIRVSGSVTNDDDATWSTINTFAFLSAAPITSEAELAAVGTVDEAADVGARITEPGTYDTIESLEPGRSAQFSVRIPRSALAANEPGVYWFGIHALGESPEGRLDGADGRARTLLPLVPPSRKSVETALVVPLRQATQYAADGSLRHVDQWTGTLAAGGRLRGLVDFGASAGARPLTWLLDPALPDAVRSLTQGNPPRSLGPAGDAGPEDPSASPEADEPDPEADPSRNPPSPEAVEAGTAWLDRLREALRAHQVLALPYGDLDVAAAADHSPLLYDAARTRSGTDLAPWDLRMSPAVAPPNGYLDTGGIATAERGATVLVTDRLFPGQAPAVARAGGARLIATSSGAAAGGPGPGARLAPLALRQRILAEAALRTLAPGRRPLVVVLPHHWAPRSTTGFFEGLDVDWVDLTTVADVAHHRARTIALEDLDYPAAQDRHLLEAASFASANALIKAGDTLQHVLAEPSGVGPVVAAEALAAVSYASRRHPVAARAAVDRSRAWIQRRLRSITVSAPRSVTLSSASGRFAATLANGLDEPVTVRIRVESDKPLDVSMPSSVDIAAEGQTTVLLNAETRTPGVHQVTLVVTDSTGTPLGGTDDLPIRSAQVSNVIWVILGTGVALLFGAIAVRLVRRLRTAARSTRADLAA